MRSVRSFRVSPTYGWLFVLAILFAPQAVRAATTWHAIAGVQRSGDGIQALAFLSNELWIHAGDSITWIFPTAESHCDLLKTWAAPTGSARRWWGMSRDDTQWL